MNKGLVRVRNDGVWKWRTEAYDGAGCGKDTYCPLVTERFGADHVDSFRDFLRAARSETTASAVRAVGVSSLFLSIGMHLPSQVDALRFRSIVCALIEHGWVVAAAMGEFGMTAADVYYDPVFGAEHPEVTTQVMNVVAGNAPWENSETLQRFSAFSGEDPDVRAICIKALTKHASEPVCVAAYELFGTDVFFSDRGRKAVLAFFWKERRDEFEDVCEDMGVPKGTALFEAYSSTGCRHAVDAAIETGDAAIAWKCARAAMTKNDAVAFRAVCAAVTGAPSGLEIAVDSCRRVIELERLVASMLMERAVAWPRAD